MPKAKEVKEGADKEQSARFIETARALGADETGKSFNKAMKAIAPKKKKRS